MLFINIVGGKDLKFTFVDTHFGNFSEFFSISHNLIFHQISNLIILKILTLQCPLLGYFFWKRNLTLFSKTKCMLSISWEKGFKFTFVDNHFDNFWDFFFNRTTPYLASVQIYSDGINFKLPPIGYIFWNRNLTLYSKMRCFLSSTPPLNH